MEEKGSTLRLIMEKGPREGETLEFSPGSVICIGRVVRGNTFSIKDAGISSKHLCIESKSGKWVIKDLDSSNGTFLNGSQLQPPSPSVLVDGDIIKVGECTSIIVKIEVHGVDSRLRMNPRRRAAKEVESDSVDVVSENRSRRGGKVDLASIGEDGASGLGVGGELGDAEEVVAANPRRRGRPRKVKVMHSETQEISIDVEKVEPKQGLQVSTRRTRSSKNLGKSTLDGNGCPELQSSAQVGVKRTCGVRGRKKNIWNEPPESIENEGLEEKECVKESNLEQEDCSVVKGKLLNEQPEAVQADGLQDEEVVVRRNLGQDSSEGLETSLGNKEIRVEADVFEDKTVVERSNLGLQACEGMGTSVGSGVEAKVGPDLEKMTLGQWFDFLEVYLPKQIYDETEEMILKMNQQAEQFHEFMVKLKNDKEKGELPMS